LLVGVEVVLPQMKTWVVAVLAALEQAQVWQ
jgi:hypothetical protein